MDISNQSIDIKNQLTVARKEIQNLRKQIRSLSHVHQTDVKIIKDLLKDFKCLGCKEQQKSNPINHHNNLTPIEKKSQKIADFKSIGTIRTEFPEKRAVPRQPTVCQKLLGCIELRKDIFNNPEHSLDGLIDFSHLWIIYHFHKNDSHAKAKVAPPRLGGERVGIFSTRSPHRPCPIGLSLVEIDRIEGRHIYFYGTDMVNDTPVLDIKPYIPRYDNPIHSGLDCRSISTEDDEQLLFDAREEPDGEETVPSNGGIARSQAVVSSSTSAELRKSLQSSGNQIQASGGLVKVPNWIMAETSLDVLFNERANQQTEDLQVNRANIVEVLKNDPRSVYLRTRYGSQIFTFQLGEVTVTCKFDDTNGIVTVVQVRQSENLTNKTSSSSTCQ